MGELERKREDVPEGEHEQTPGENVEASAVVLAGKATTINSTLVADIEHKIAELIDIAEGLKQNDPRRAAVAQTDLEKAMDFMVKAATQ
ncbi:MAG: hypothetical protein C5B54_04720 [Acidobacteria bacterium]|nr:MAG: hypothetical protein C5B54_04720 [Acidobacteriota bacterium]